MIYSLLIQMHWSQWPQFNLASLWPSRVFSPIWTTAIPESSGTNRVWVRLWSWWLRWWKRLKILHLNKDFLPRDLRRATTQPRALWPFQRRWKRTKQRITAESQPGVRICGVARICLLKVICVSVLLLWRKHFNLVVSQLFFLITWYRQTFTFSALACCRKHSGDDELHCRSVGDSVWCSSARRLCDSHVFSLLWFCEEVLWRWTQCALVQSRTREISPKHHLHWRNQTWWMWWETWRTFSCNELLLQLL